VITILWILLFFCVVGVLAYHRASLIVWTISFFLFFLLHTRFSEASSFLRYTEFSLFLIIAVFLNIPSLRQYLFSKRILNIYRRLMPSMSHTEQESLEAGTVDWEASLFSGMPDWEKMLAYSAGKLSHEEKNFLDTSVEEACRLANDWNITQNLADLPKELWDFLKKEGFFGLIIPKQYGGKEFSATAHLAILTKLYGRCSSLATTVSVPNSLGPAELLLQYGTEEQKNYYLPRLARGEEIPCFALTSPEAGSDAASMPDTGIICRGLFEGKEIIGIRLNWNKRYITLAPVATILGLAFKCYDPDHLLGDTVNIGITCALIPVQTPGITIGRRHFPLNVVFQNGPTQGHDVFIPLDWIIGGEKMLGHGWRMLMECLAAGRGISLPSTAVGGSKLASFATGAYARIRKQFNLPVGKFEGVEEALAMIGGYTYMINAGVKFAVAAIDRGDKPAVASAIMKYHATELGRKTINHAMDIHGGKGICLGEHNYIGRNYEAIPISITVEGANILTRNLIIFGQGAIRCHPYVLAELKAAQDSNQKRGLKNFDRALFQHLGFTISNKVRTFFLGLTSARFVSTPVCSVSRYYQHFTRFSSALAFLADFCMFWFGGNLKRKERISARLGDILSLLFIGSGVLKQYAEQGYPELDKPFVDWSCQYLLFSLQRQINVLLQNFPNRWIASMLHFLIFPFGKHFVEPSDKLDHAVADLLLNPNEARTRLTEGLYLSGIENNPLAVLEDALHKVIAAEPLEKRMKEALAHIQIQGTSFAEQIKACLARGVLNESEAALVRAAEEARKAVIAVDDFAPEELSRR
jgi:acyl-CoA dehydrogenase